MRLYRVKINDIIIKIKYIFIKTTISILQGSIMEKSNWELLKTKEFCQLFNGDGNLGEYNGIFISFPYMSGYVLEKLSCDFGLLETSDEESKSIIRWEAMQKLISYCINNDKMNNLLKHLLSIKHFEKLLKHTTGNDVKETHLHITEALLQKINNILVFSDNELVVIGNNYIIIKNGEKIEISAPTLKIIDSEYIIAISERACSEIDNCNFDSAITKARTLLEEVFIYVIEQKDEEPSACGSILELYKQVKSLYNMHNDKDLEKCINKLLSGLNSIVDAIAEMRNRNSDAHGSGTKRKKISDYHARLFVNSAISVAEFILSVHKNSMK